MTKYILVLEYFVFEHDLRSWKKESAVCKLAATRKNPSSPNLHVHGTAFNFFIFPFKERQKYIFKASQRDFFPALAMVAHTIRTTIKNNHYHSQTASSEMSTCRYVTEKK